VKPLPDFPWDRLVPYKAQAGEHVGGIVDLSVGTPVDPTPSVVQEALAASANAPGYPTTHGTPQLRLAVVDYLRRRFGIEGLDPQAVLPTIGSKEFVAWLPTMLGLGPQNDIGSTVVVPDTAYPTYEVGGLIAGCQVVPMSQADAALDAGQRIGLMWLNSPANPTGRITPGDELAKIVAWARERDILVVSDECYLEFGWDSTPVSTLHTDVCGGTHEGLLSVHSLSKRSNLAGYRGGFVTGDPDYIARLLEIRKHAGMMVPRPIQDAMTAALGDDAHVDQQRARYLERRATLRESFTRAGFRIDDSQGALYLWATREESCWESVRWCAERGVLVAPGEFYGTSGAGHVRVAFTATDERVAEVAARF
jgi:succinyldiaminopimelate transaminase